MKKIVKLFLSIMISCTLILGLASCKDEKDEKSLVDNPTAEYVIECLQKVPLIVEIEAVTEDNDPIGQLNKPNGYTAHIYFSYSLINQDEVYGNDLIDKGTDAGGSIEVYTTEKDANRRDAYLATFDGTVLTSGSHTVIGTIVVRTSHELTATQQKILEKNIIAALQGFDDKIVNPNNSSNNNNGNNEKYPSAIGSYFNLDYTLNIYDDGTLYLSYNGEYMDIEGTWTQSDNEICYNVWNIDGFEWNNPFYGTVYADGIDFLGDFYKRI